MMRRNCYFWRLLQFVLAAHFLCASGSAQQTPLVLRGGKLLTVSHGTIENGVSTASRTLSLRPAAATRFRDGIHSFSLPVKLRKIFCWCAISPCR